MPVSKIMIIGGAPRSLILFRGNLIREWIELGFKVIAMAAPAKNDLLEEISNLGVKYISIPIERDRMNFINDLGLIFKLRKIIKVEKPEYIFAYTVKPIIYSALAGKVYKEIEFYFMISGLGFAFTGESVKQKLIRLIITFLYRIALKRSRVIFFQNQDDLEVFHNLQIMPRDKKAVVINGSGVDTGYYYFSEYQPRQEVSFLLIARLINSKGIKNYVEAARMVKEKHHHAIFHLIGHMNDSPDAIVQNDLDAWQAEGVIDYLGYQADVRPSIMAAAVYVLPSYREGMPRSVLEAMSMGRPVITTDVPGCRETVIEGVNGYLVPVKNSAALAEAMERFILEPGLINTMGLASRKIAETKFDVHTVNKTILAAMGISI